MCIYIYIYIYIYGKRLYIGKGEDSTKELLICGEQPARKESMYLI